jgi:hypothetical protein
MSAKPRGGVVEEEISVKTLYNSGSEGWATFGDLGRIFVGTLLGSVMFTCDVFFEFVACLGGLDPVATQWLIWGGSERLCSDTSVTSVEITLLKIARDKGSD